MAAGQAAGGDATVAQLWVALGRDGKADLMRERLLELTAVRR